MHDPGCHNAVTAGLKGIPEHPVLRRIHSGPGKRNLARIIIYLVVCSLLPVDAIQAPQEIGEIVFLPESTPVSLPVKCQDGASGGILGESVGVEEAIDFRG